LYLFDEKPFSLTGGMMIKIVLTLLLSGPVVLLVLFSGPSEAGGIKGSGPSGLQLSKKVHRLLSAEMNAIQNGMTNMAIAVPAGRWNDVAETARKIKEGYIMNKEMTEEQMKEFTGSLPAGYIERDRKFMETAGMLITAAREKDREHIQSLIYQLNKGCVQCHATYAQKRFPGFRE
jgi:cytochrome c556